MVFLTIVYGFYNFVYVCVSHTAYVLGINIKIIIENTINKHWYSILCVTQIYNIRRCIL